METIVPYGNKATFILVFELPMRDGNTQTQLIPWESGKVFELPMRDGNQLIIGCLDEELPGF